MPAWGRVTVYTVKSGPLPGVGQDQGSSGPALGEKSSPVRTEGPPRFVWRAEARRCQQPSEKAREARITGRLRCSARPENLVPCLSAVDTYWGILAPAGSRQQWVHRRVQIRIQLCDQSGSDEPHVVAVAVVRSHRHARTAIRFAVNWFRTLRNQRSASALGSLCEPWGAHMGRR